MSKRVLFNFLTRLFSVAAIIPIISLFASATADHTTRFTYDANGNLETVTDAKGSLIRYEYDAADQLIAVRYPGGSSVTFAYDATGRRTQMIEELGSTTTEYDILGRAVEVRDLYGNSLHYHYEAGGRLSELVYPDGESVAFAWGIGGQLTSAQDAFGQSRYEYDLGGRITRRQLPNGVISEYEYDAAGRLALIRHANATGEALLVIAYEFDAINNRTKMTRSANDGEHLVTRYEYDAVSRLVRAFYPDGEEVHYDYDAAGNRLTRFSSRHGAIHYTYDRLGQLIELRRADDVERFHYDANGNLSERRRHTGTIHYSWDFENRLSGIATGSDTIRYVYDGDGRRLAKIVNGVETRFVQQGNMMPQVLLATSQAGTRRVLLGSSPVGEFGAQGPLYYLEDGLGSVIGVTDAAGQLLHEYEYDAFGALRHADSLTTLLGFTGEQHEAESGLIFLRARYYDPQLGRFLSADPHPPDLLNPQTLNRYVYVGNNPGNVTDPLGLQWWNPPPYYWWPDDQRRILELILGAQVATGRTERVEGRWRYMGIQVGWSPMGSLWGELIGGSAVLFPADNGPIQFSSSLGPMGALYSASWDVGTRKIQHGSAFWSDSHDFTIPFLPVSPVWNYSVTRTPSIFGIPVQEFAPTLNTNKSSATNLQLSQVNINAAMNTADLLRRRDDYASHVPPFPPGGTGGAVGGISLDRVAQVLVNLNDFTGAAFDSTTGQVILIGRKDLTLPALDVDDLVVAIRTIYAGQEPSMSIEPCTPGSNDGCMKVLYNGVFRLPDHPEWGWVHYNHEGELERAEAPATFGTHFGWVLYEADRYLKTATLGWDNLNQEQAFETEVPDFRSELARLAARASNDSSLSLGASDRCRIMTEEDRQRSSNCHRLWFVPDSIILKVSKDRRMMEFAPVNIKTEARFVRFDEAGRMVDVPGDDPAVAEFVDHFNAHYAEFAQEKTELAELIQLAKVVALVRWLRDYNIPLDLSWIDRYHIKNGIATPDTTPGIAAIAGRVKIYGGVEFPRNNGYQPTNVQRLTTAEAVMEKRASLAASSWQTPSGGDTLEAVAVHLAPSTIVGGFTLTRMDAQVPLQAGLTATLTRRYNSLDPAPSLCGRGWTLVQPYLSFKRVAAEGETGRYYTQAVLQIDNGIYEFRLNDDGFFRPARFDVPFRVLGLASDDLFSPVAAPNLRYTPVWPGRPLRVQNDSGAYVSFSGFAMLAKDGSALAFDPTGRLTAIRAAGGALLYFEYDGERLVFVGNEQRRGISLEYDAEERLQRLQTSQGDTVQYAYDGAGNLVEVSSNGGSEEYYEYDSAGRMVAIRNGDGHLIMQTEYDALGRVISSHAPSSRPLIAEFDDQQQTVIYRDSSRALLTRQYDRRQRLRRETDALGNSRTFSYNGERLSQLTDRKDNLTQFEYDGNGSLTRIIDPLGRETRFLNHTDFGLPQIAIASDHSMVITRYDELGRVVSVDDGLKLTRLSSDGEIAYEAHHPSRIEFSYDQDGNTTAVKGAGEEVTRFSYDEFGKLETVHLPNGGTRRVAYSADARITQITTTAGHTTTFEYDSNGRPSAIITPAGATRMQYAGGRLTAVTNPLDQTMRMAYDTTGALIAVTDPNGEATAYDYDGLGNLIAITDALGARVRYEYDVLGRLLSVSRME